jgi:hypothetical protein
MPKAALGFAALLGTLQKLYHGTTLPAAENIMKHGFDLNKFGTGADSAFEPAAHGWKGKGVYGSVDPEQAHWYAGFNRYAPGHPDPAPPLPRQQPAVVESIVDDKHIFDALPDANSPHGGWPLIQLLDDFDKTRGLEGSWTDFVNKWAQQRGYKGVKHGRETVIFDTSILEPTTVHKYDPPSWGLIP